jgi:hypothetical protein
MGMTIDEAIEIINHYLDYPKEEVRKALLVAIETMRKYQKIEEIVKAWNDMNSFDSMLKISEVLEDGRND